SVECKIEPHRLPNIREAFQQGFICDPTCAIKMPSTRMHGIGQERSVPVGLQNPEMYPGANTGFTLHLAFYDDGCRKIREHPGLGLWGPDTGLAYVFVADDHVHIAVVVEVQDANPVVLPSLRVAQRHPTQQVFGEPLLRLAEREEFHL